MALIKNKTLDNGTQGSYWKIVNLNINYVEASAQISLALFKDKAFKESEWNTGKNEKVVMDYTEIYFGGPDFPFEESEIKNKDILGEAYKEVKKQPFFIDATDDV